MTSVQGTYTDFSEYPRYNPEELFIYNKPWNSVMTAPQRSAAMVQIAARKAFSGSSGDWKRDDDFPYLPVSKTFFTGYNPTSSSKYEDQDGYREQESILGKLQEKYPLSQIYLTIIKSNGFYIPKETKAGLSTNIIPSNERLSDFYQKANTLTVFLSINDLAIKYVKPQCIRRSTRPDPEFADLPNNKDNEKKETETIKLLLNSTIKRRISPSEFGYKREQSILGQRILLKNEKGKLYVGFSPCPPITHAASSCGGFNDYIDNRINWRSIENFFVTMNGYLYLYK